MLLIYFALNKTRFYSFVRRKTRIKEQLIFRQRLLILYPLYLQQNKLKMKKF